MLVRKKQEGFTIIEVVLVLAIAGLIFLMVFVALPALQRTQRDAQRKQDMSRLLTAVSNYQTKNRNKSPFSTNQSTTATNVARMVQRYVDSECRLNTISGDSQIVSFSGCGDEFRDPDGTIYQFYYLGTTDKDVGWLRGIDKDHSVTGTITELHTFYVANRAICGSVEGTVSKSNGLNEIAILMKLESGAIACVDNM